MQFRFDEDQLAMRDAVRAFCGHRFDLSSVAEREGQATDAATWAGLAELGILGMLADIGPVEAAMVFEDLGVHLATGPVLWSTLAASHVEGVADGAVRVAGVEIDGDGPVVVEHGDEADVVLVLRGDRAERVDRAALPPAEPASPLDPLTPVSVYDALPVGEVVAGGGPGGPPPPPSTRLSSALLVGLAQGALDTAREYALEREQFDRPIGSFQAIKHLLADMYVRVELARAAAYAAAAIAAGRGDGDPLLNAASAKVLAGEAALANGRSAVQVLGGMGFTWEMLPHYFLKRAWVLDQSFGTGSAHAARLGDAVAAR
jgi:alkylation response protein AidB-like acyl-CoA dehydrogenase